MKKNGRFKIIQKDFNKNDRYFLNEQLFSKTLVFLQTFEEKKTIVVFTERTILLNKQFY